MKSLEKVFMYSLLVIIIDQVTKFFVVNAMRVGQTIPIIKHFFNITYIENDGGAFNIFSGNLFFLVAIAVIALFIIYFFFLRNSYLNKFEMVSYGFLIGGIIGNMFDRIFNHSVIDFLDFTFINFPVFNFADVFIVVGVILIIIELIKEKLIDERT